MAKGERLPRLLRLIHTIQSHPGLTVNDLVEECGVGKRQLFRDLRELEYAGVPVYHDKGYRLAGKFLLQEVSFSLDEALALLYGLKLVERQKGLFPIERVKKHLMSLLPGSLQEGIQNLSSQVEVVEETGADYSGKGELFRILHQAMRETRQVEIEYYSFGRNEENRRCINPYHLIFKDGFWYLVAFCHLRQAQRLFRVDRIRHSHLLLEKFELPAGEFQVAPLEAAWGIELGAEFEFRVRFWGDSARYVCETRFHAEQQIETGVGGSVCFSAKACGLRPLVRWVLSFGGEAEVLEPPKLRAMVAEALSAGAANY